MATTLRGTWEKYLPPPELGPGDPYGIQEAQIEQTYGDLERRVADAFRQGNTLDLGAQAAWKRYQDAYAQPMPQQGLGSIFDQGFGNIGSVLAGDQQFGRQAAQRTQQNLGDARQRQAMQVDQLMNEYNRMIAAAMEQKKYAEAFDMTTKSQKLAAMGGLAQQKREDEKWQMERAMAWEKHQEDIRARQQMQAERLAAQKDEARRKNVGAAVTFAKQAETIFAQQTQQLSKLYGAKKELKDAELSPVRSTWRSALKRTLEAPLANNFTGDPIKEDPVELRDVVLQTLSMRGVMRDPQDEIFRDKPALLPWKSKQEFVADIRAALNTRLSDPEMYPREDRVAMVDLIMNNLDSMGVYEQLSGGSKK